MAGGWPSRIVGRSVGLRGGTARQSRPRGSVLGSAASRCVVDYPLLPHSLTASSVALTFSTFARPLDSRRFSLSLRVSPPLSSRPSLVSVSRPRVSVSRSRFSSLFLCLSFSLSRSRRLSLVVSSTSTIPVVIVAVLPPRRGSLLIAHNSVFSTVYLFCALAYATRSPLEPFLLVRSPTDLERNPRERDAS